MAAAAVLAGARSMAAIAEWAADAPQPIRAALGARRDAPGHLAVPAEATIRRTLARLDAEALAAAIGAWLADRDAPPSQPAAGGRGGRQDAARRPRRDGRPVHLLARWTTPPARCWPNARSTAHLARCPAFQPLLAGLDLAGVVVTADALQTHPEAAEFLVGRQARALPVIVKANQPTLLDRCQRLAWHHVPVLDRTRDRGHGRIEIRTLKAVSVRHFGFPHAAQILQVTRKTRDLHDHPRRSRP